MLSVPLRAVLALLLVFGVAVLPASAAGAAPSDDITFHDGKLALHGTVLTPGTPGRHPAVVIVSGAGQRNRNSYRPEAEAFARAGIVTLIYDKRANYSRATSSFPALADDALAGVEALRRRADVDPARVGLWGHSEGGWVVPLAASRSSDVAFVVTVGASALHADRTQLWSDRAYLAHDGVAPELRDPIGVNLSRMLIAGGLFGDVSNDPLANLSRVRQPVLSIWGAEDRSCVPGESLRLFRKALTDGGNDHYTLRVVPGADHDLRRARHDGYGHYDSPFAPGYLHLVTSWIRGLPGTAAAEHADAPPRQPLTSSPTRPLAVYEAIPLHVGAFVLLLLAFLAYPVGALLRRVRRQGRPPAPWSARLVALTGVAAVLGTPLYLGFIVATGATIVGPVVLGRPVAWLVLQLATLALLGCAARLAVVTWHTRTADRPRRAILLAASALLIPFAVYWGLLTP